MSPFFFLFLFFCILAVVLVATAVGFNFLEGQRKKQVKSLLSAVEGKSAEEETSILVEPNDGDDPLRKMAIRLNILDKLETPLRQSGLDWSASKLLGVMLVFAGIGFLIGWKMNLFIFGPLSALIFGAGLGFIPLFYVFWQRSKRFSQFEEQFPEALDFLARSMRAGHAFSISLEMLGTESPEPLGTEFRTLFNETNLGAPLEAAFASMVRRLPLIDVRFFVSSVMLQKQTGGNLSEILVRLSYVIRERFRLKGQVKAASAHGKMTAGILVAMPIVLMFALLFVAPGYLQGMAQDPDGKKLIVAAMVAQLLGFYFIRRIIRIKI